MSERLRSVHHKGHALCLCASAYLIYVRHISRDVGDMVDAYELGVFGDCVGYVDRGYNAVFIGSDFYQIDVHHAFEFIERSGDGIVFVGGKNNVYMLIFEVEQISEYREIARFRAVGRKYQFMTAVGAEHAFEELTGVVYLYRGVDRIVVTSSAGVGGI